MVGNLKTEYSTCAVQGAGSPCLQAFPTLTPTLPQLIPPHPSEHGNINITCSRNNHLILSMHGKPGASAPPNTLQSTLSNLLTQHLHTAVVG